jgi:polyferredoxin
MTSKKGDGGMNWKEVVKFLKPNWTKFVLFVIITLLFPYIGFLSLFVMWGAYWNIVTGHGGLEKSSEAFSFSIPIWIVCYLISCLIVWIYDKLRKK